MHPILNQASAITSAEIGAAIEVHRDKGPGLLESIYEWCFHDGLATVRTSLCRGRRTSSYDISSLLAKMLG
ncbi:MAG: hypothetical protein NXI32_23000 [bacterium]|nr:hypothetical protein [bacterium]